MNHYDDLQRFKDKTRNQNHDFKDLSAQKQAHEHGNWAIINQFAPASEDAGLAMGGHVSLPQPQPVDPERFAATERLAPAAHVETPAASVSLFQEVAEQLSAAAPAPVAGPVRHEEAAAAPVAAAPVTAPALARASSRPASASAPADYARLFAAKVADAKPDEEKERPLHSLLERIASCR